MFGSAWIIIATMAGREEGLVSDRSAGLTEAARRDERFRLRERKRRNAKALGVNDRTCDASTGESHRAPPSATTCASEPPVRRKFTKVRVGARIWGEIREAINLINAGDLHTPSRARACENTIPVYDPTSKAARVSSRSLTKPLTIFMPPPFRTNVP